MKKLFCAVLVLLLAGVFSLHTSAAGYAQDFADCSGTPADCGITTSRYVKAEFVEVARSRSLVLTKLSALAPSLRVNIPLQPAFLSGSDSIFFFVDFSAWSDPPESLNGEFTLFVTLHAGGQAYTLPNRTGKVSAFLQDERRQFFALPDKDVPNGLVASRNSLFSPDYRGYIKITLDSFVCGSRSFSRELLSEIESITLEIASLKSFVGQCVLVDNFTFIAHDSIFEPQRIPTPTTTTTTTTTAPGKTAKTKATKTTKAKTSKTTRTTRTRAAAAARPRYTTRIAGAGGEAFWDDDLWDDEFWEEEPVDVEPLAEPAETVTLNNPSGSWNTVLTLALPVLLLAAAIVYMSFARRRSGSPAAQAAAESEENSKEEE